MEDRGQTWVEITQTFRDGGLPTPDAGSPKEEDFPPIPVSQNGDTLPIMKMLKPQGWSSTKHKEKSA